MIALVAILAVALPAALVAQAWVFTRHMDGLRLEREDLARLLVARHAGEALALVPPRSNRNDSVVEEPNPYRNHPPLPEGI